MPRRGHRSVKLLSATKVDVFWGQKERQFCRSRARDKKTGARWGWGAGGQRSGHVGPCRLGLSVKGSLYSVRSTVTPRLHIHWLLLTLLRELPSEILSCGSRKAGSSRWGFYASKGALRSAVYLNKPTFSLQAVSNRFQLQTWVNLKHTFVGLNNNTALCNCSVINSAFRGSVSVTVPRSRTYRARGWHLWQGLTEKVRTSRAESGREIMGGLGVGWSCCPQAAGWGRGQDSMGTGRNCHRMIEFLHSPG